MGVDVRQIKRNWGPCLKAEGARGASSHQLPSPSAPLGYDSQTLGARAEGGLVFMVTFSHAQLQLAQLIGQRGKEKKIVQICKLIKQPSSNHQNM